MERAEFGVLADTVEAITTLSIETLQSPPGSTAVDAGNCLKGVTADALIVLDGAALLSDDRFFVDQA
jgi:chemotaxis signal transduction protein